MTAPITDAKEGRRSVLGRAFDILECFADGDQEQTISSLCAKTELPPATVHRMLVNLTEWGAVERSGRGRYRLGMRLWRLGWGVPMVRDLKDIARPCLVDLHVATGSVAVLASRDGDQVVLADIIAGNKAVRRQRLPRHMPVVGSAPGSVYLANMSRDEAAGLLGEDDPRQTSFEFWQRLGEIRSSGVSVVRAAGPRDLTWVSAPAFDGARHVRSTVSVAVPGAPDNVIGLARVVADSARAISRGLTHSVAAAS